MYYFLFFLFCPCSRFCWLWSQRGTEERKDRWIEKEGKGTSRQTVSETWRTEKDLLKRSCECLPYWICFQKCKVLSWLLAAILICRSLQEDCLRNIPWPQVRRFLKCDGVLGQPSNWMIFSPMMRWMQIFVCAVVLLCEAAVTLETPLVPHCCCLATAHLDQLTF